MPDLHSPIVRPEPRFGMFLVRAFRLFGSAVLCGLVCGAAKPGSEQPVNPPVEMTVRLPPFVVTEVRDGLPWKYGRAGNFEVLSLCSENLTQEFVTSLMRGSDFFPEI